MITQKIKQIVFFVFLSCLFSQNYDYSLQDVNPNSNLVGTSIGPSYFEGKVTINYFGWES